MGHKCWGLFDDKCDTRSLMVIDGELNISTSGSAFRVDFRSFSMA